MLVPVITNWTGVAGWVAKFYYDYYVFTGDLTFLKKKALLFQLPLMQPWMVRMSTEDEYLRAIDIDTPHTDVRIAF